MKKKMTDPEALLKKAKAFIEERTNGMNFYEIIDDAVLDEPLATAINRVSINSCDQDHLLRRIVKSKTKYAAWQAALEDGHVLEDAAMFCMNEKSEIQNLSGNAEYKELDRLEREFTSGYEVAYRKAGLLAKVWLEAEKKTRR